MTKEVKVKTNSRKHVQNGSKMFIGFSGYHFRAMYQFARASQEIEQEPDSKREAENAAFAIGAVTSSVGFLESHINELFMSVSEADGGMFYRKLNPAAKKGIKNLWEDAGSKLAILPKWDLVLALSGSPQFDHALNLTRTPIRWLNCGMQSRTTKSGIGPTPNRNSRNLRNACRRSFHVANTTPMGCFSRTAV